MDKSFVYFAKVSVEGEWAIKIGVSQWPKYRVRHEIGGSLITYAAGDYYTEQAIHSIFKKYTVQGREWFRPNRSLYKLMQYCVDHGELPSNVVQYADAYRRYRLAKRDMLHSLTEAFAGFKDDSFGWSDEHFKIGQKLPAPTDDSWFPMGWDNIKHPTTNAKPSAAGV